MESCFDLSTLRHSLPFNAAQVSWVHLIPKDKDGMARSSPILACSAEILDMIADCTHEDAIRDLRVANKAFAKATVRAYAKILCARHFTMTESSLQKLLQISQHAVFAKDLKAVKINSFDIYKDQEMFMSEANEQDTIFFDDHLTFLQRRGDSQMLKQICSNLAPLNHGKIAIEVFEGSWHSATPDRGPEMYEESHSSARALVLLTDAARAGGCTISELQLRLRELGYDKVLNGALCYAMLIGDNALNPDMALRISQAFPELTTNVYRSPIKSHPAFEVTIGGRIYSGHDFNKDPPRSITSLHSIEQLEIQKLSLGPKWWTWSSTASSRSSEDMHHNPADNLEMCYRFATSISKLRVISLRDCEILRSEFMMLIKRHEKTLRELELHDVALPHSQKWSQTLGSLGYLWDLEKLSISHLVVANPDPGTSETCPVDDFITECACPCEYDCCEVVLEGRRTWVGVEEVQAGISRTVKELADLEAMPDYCLEVEDEDDLPPGAVNPMWADGYRPSYDETNNETYEEAYFQRRVTDPEVVDYDDDDDMDGQHQEDDQN